MKRRAEKIARAALLALPVVLALALIAHAAAARPGGGQSFGSPSSGGSRSSGGGGGGGGDCFALLELVFWLIELHVESPGVALVVDAILLVGGIWVYSQHRKVNHVHDWSSATPRVRTPPAFVETRSNVVRSRLSGGVVAQDPDFSLPIFEDFVYALYATYQEDRGKGDLSALRPYLTEEVAKSHASLDPSLARVDTIVVGALRYVEATASKQSGARVLLEIEANYTETQKSGKAQSYYVKDRWTLTRPVTARSRPPARARTLDCPSCGAPLSAIRGGVCSYCKNDVGQGAFDWRVVEVQSLAREARGPMLTGETEERGTNLPTIVETFAQQKLQSMTRRDAAFTWEAFTLRLGVIFADLQRAWSARDLLPVRGLLSDQLFQTQLYWVETYKREGLRNITEGSRITRVELAAVESDRYYDAITVRVFATGLDYTVRDEGGEVVSGSKKRPRAYSEYWTLIRGRGAQTKPVQGPPACPYCGAPLAVNMAGDCTYCKAKITMGEFDWVLSRVEQDEVYG